MREVHPKNALKLIDGIVLLDNVVRRHVKPFKRSNRLLGEPLKKLSAGDPALREIAEAGFS